MMIFILLQMALNLTRKNSHTFTNGAQFDIHDEKYITT